MLSPSCKRYIVLCPAPSHRSWCCNETDAPGRARRYQYYRLCPLTRQRVWISYTRTSMHRNIYAFAYHPFQLHISKYPSFTYPSHPRCTWLTTWIITQLASDWSITKHTTALCQSPCVHDGSRLQHQAILALIKVQ